MDKAFGTNIIFFIVILFTVNFLRAGSSSSGEKFRSAVDIEVEDGLKGICIENTKISVPLMFSHFGSTDLVESFYFYSTVDEKTTDVESLEKRMVKTVEALLQMLNHMPQIRPYLLTFPLTIGDMRYELQLRRKQNDAHYLEPNIAVALFSNKLLKMYVKHDPNNPNALPLRQDIVGRKIIKEIPVSDIPRLAALKDVPVPRSYEKVKRIDQIKSLSISIDVDPDRSFMRYLGKYLKKYPYNIASLTRAADKRKGSNYRPISVGLWSYATIDLEQAQTVGRKIFNDFYTWAITDPAMIKSEEFNRSEGCRMYEGTDGVSFRITYWDQHFNRVESPYIAQILCQDSVIEYYTADEGQRLVKVFEEPTPIVYIPPI